MDGVIEVRARKVGEKKSIQGPDGVYNNNIRVWYMRKCFFSSLHIVMYYCTIPFQFSFFFLMTMPQTISLLASVDHFAV